MATLGSSKPPIRWLSPGCCRSPCGSGSQPGIQCRSVVIFEGPQDIGKSKLIKMAGEAWCREVSGTLKGRKPTCS